MSLAITVVVAAISITVVISIMIAVTSAAFEGEIGAATMVHPDAPVIRTPAVAFAAGGFAALLYQTSSALPVGWTIMTLPVVRRTLDGLRRAMRNENCERGRNHPQVNPILYAQHCRPPESNWYRSDFDRDA